MSMSEQELFDRLVDLNKEALTLAEDISQLKKDVKFHKETNPNGISADDIKFVSAAAKLEAKQQFEEFSGDNAAVIAKYKELTKYD
jgi:regulator of replication initiation timing